MPILYDANLMRQIIMDHYQYPRNKKLTHLPNYSSIRMDSEGCVDDITLEVLIENGVLVDLRFEGVACTISTASTSILTELLKGKTVDEARYLIDQFYHMIKQEPYDPEILDEANVFINTGKQANRIKCATIGWKGLLEILDRQFPKGGNDK